MPRFPSFVDLEFTARCNLKCGFCFGPADDGGKTPHLDPEFWIGVIDAIRSRGCLGIVVSGGEPTLYPHLKQLLAYAQQRGLQTVLSTHGRHESRLLDVAGNCDWIALPVDGVSKDSLVEMRGDSWGLARADELAKILKDTTGGRVSIKLGSVATRLNRREVVHLANSLLDLELMNFDTWKIYQYTPRRKFAERKEMYEISDELFDNLRQDVEATGLAKRLNTVWSSHQRRRRAYLFVYPDGTLAIPNEGESFGDVVIGNVVTDGFSVFDRVRAYEFFSNDQNFVLTYG